MNIDRQDSLLDNAPDGLGKHCEVYKVNIVTTDYINKALEIGKLPFFILHKSERYLVIVGSDITNEDTLEMLSVNEAAVIYKEIHWYIQRVFNYLKMNELDIHVDLIGNCF